MRRVRQTGCEKALEYDVALAFDVTLDFLRRRPMGSDPRRLQASRSGRHSIRKVRRPDAGFFPSETMASPIFS